MLKKGAARPKVALLAKNSGALIKLARNLNSVKQWRYLESSSMTAISIIFVAKVLMQAELFAEYLDKHDGKEEEPDDYTSAMRPSGSNR